MGRLRSRVADQLLNDLDPPDHHETLIKLKEMKEKEEESEEIPTEMWQESSWITISAFFEEKGKQGYKSW